VSLAIESLAGMTVGTVESVAPDELKVLLEFDAPQSTSLNTGQPSRFPRINGFVLVPNEAGSLVGLVTWLGVERASHPKRTGLSDFGLVDLPFPLRKMSVNPIATLHGRAGETGYALERGVSVLPSVGDPVVLPSNDQLRAILESQGANRRVAIGTSTLAADAVVAVDPDKLFGRHLAVLGNTGSGKSCSVAGIIRWSIVAGEQERAVKHRPGPANARFIVLDPNGEYLHTFADLTDHVRVFRPILAGHAHQGDVQPLLVPAWMWNSHEWSAFTQASPGVQRPILLRALRGMRAGRAATDNEEVSLARLMRGYGLWLDQLMAQGPAWHGGDYRGRQDTGGFLRAIEREIAVLVGRHVDHEAELRAVGYAAAELAHTNETVTQAGPRYSAFTEADLLGVKHPLEALLATLPEPAPTGVASEDSPLVFDVDHLPEYLELLAKSADFSQGAQHVPMLVTRIRTLLADPRLAPIVDPEEDPTLESWLSDYIGADAASNGQIAVVDLSLVPSDVLHLAISVIARLVFEACQRYRKLTGQELPTALVLEEAHSFIRRAPAGGDSGESTTATVCRETFERIAREGRKFGLGLVLSSQRPSELSPTVLAQCNTFLLHRIVNDRDQDLVGRLVPDNLGGLLRELPSLPSRQAILLGWATPVPILVEISELPVAHRPTSNDPHFWGVWTGAEDRPIDWRSIAEDWVGP
jgi:DNA helicase HerA-like ATPase